MFHTQRERQHLFLACEPLREGSKSSSQEGWGDTELFGSEHFADRATILMTVVVARCGLAVSPYTRGTNVVQEYAHAHFQVLLLSPFKTLILVS